jgi:hypothetical protein
MNIETIKLLITSAWGIDDETYDLTIEDCKLESNTSENYTKTFRWFSKKI